MENLGNSENLRNCENLGENLGKFEFFVEKTWKTQRKRKRCDMIANKNAFH